MGGILKFLGGLILAVALVLAVGFLVLRRGDIPLETLKQNYAVPASQYMAMPDGVVVHYRDEGADKTAAGKPEDEANFCRGFTDPACVDRQRAAARVPTLVMIHGFSASTRDWDDWIRILKPHYRIISLDLPGHGLTSAPAGYKASIKGYADLVDAVTARLGVRKFVLIGNSMGGGTAWTFALRHPDRLDGLVLVDAVGWDRPKGRDTGKGPIIFRIMRSPAGLWVLRRIDIRPLITQGLKSAFVDEKLVTPALVDRYSDFARAPGHRDILTSIQSGARAPVTEATIATIKVPTLILHGRDDKVIPFGNALTLHQWIKDSQLHGFGRCGHWVQIEHAARFVRLLSDFFAEDA